MEIEPARLEAFAAAVRPRLAGDLRLDALSKALYATDASLYREPPLGVLIPRHADDVQAALEAAGREAVASHIEGKDVVKVVVVPGRLVNFVVK